MQRSDQDGLRQETVSQSSLTSPGKVIIIPIPSAQQTMARSCWALAYRGRSPRTLEPVDPATPDCALKTPANHRRQPQQMPLRPAR